MASLLLGLLAGALTTLSPCVLPVLPFVVFAALDRHRFGPIALAAGMASTFAVVGIAIASLSFDTDTVRAWAGVLMAIFGIVLLSPGLYERFAVFVAPLASRIHGSTPGLGSQFAVGALLGAAWSPCSGPTLGAAITLAASSQTAAKAGAIMLFFALGASLPLLVLAYGSRASLQRRRVALREAGRIATPLTGGAMVIWAALILSGWDRVAEASLLRAMTDSLVTLITRF